LVECLHDNFENEALRDFFIHTRTFNRVLHAILFSTAYDIFLPFKSLPFFTAPHTGYYVKEAGNREKMDVFFGLALLRTYIYSI
jgi:hypothetical protein